MSDDTFDIARLVRPAVAERVSYIPAAGAAKKPDGLIRLDMNESPYGPSDRTRAAILDFVETNRYPDFQQTALRTALSDYTGVAIEQIICGAGLDDGFVAVAMALIDPGDQVIISEPTFGVYRPLFSLHGADVMNVPLTADFELQPDAIIRAVTDRTKIIIICAPNNPTGNIFSQEAIDQVCEQANCLVAIDEAYAEFGGRSHIPLMQSRANVMVLRTMSKWAGLAGMRVGYGLVPTSLAAIMRHVVPPFHNVSLISSQAAIAALDDRESLLRQVGKICADRDSLAADIARVPGMQPLPSVTNFVLVRTPFPDASPLVASIAQRGVLVRSYGDPVLRPYLRVTVGTPAENEI